ncbi:hypothetical protein F4779DRAFT_600306 [Xylariaceae sp. FL0662B]|nr:hypothetical protein F4779DRAFT_600306 [Xylariaceae sp. FL0662B]
MNNRQVFLYVVAVSFINYARANSGCRDEVIGEIASHVTSLLSKAFIEAEDSVFRRTFRLVHAPGLCGDSLPFRVGLPRTP